MLLEVGFGGGIEIWCALGEQRITLHPEQMLVASTPDDPSSEMIDEMYMMTWGPRHIGYKACLTDIPPPSCTQLDILCIGGEEGDMSALKAWLEVLRPKYCIPLGKRASNKAQQWSQEVMATGATFPKLLRPGQVVVMQHG